MTAPLIDLSQNINAQIIQGEGRWVKFTYTDENDDPIEMPDAGNYTAVVKTEIGATDILYEVTTFDLTNRLTGIIRANLPASATINFPPGNIYVEITAVVTEDTDVDKQQVKLKIKQKT